MNIKIQFRNLEPAKNHQKVIDRQSAKIDKMLPTFPEDARDLAVTVEKLPRGSQYQTSLVLTLPQKVIRVEEMEDNPVTSIVSAFSELRRRIKRFKSQLNRERLWRKQPPTAAAVATPPQVWEVESAIAENLEKLENYVRREIYHSVLTGVLPPGVLEPTALVDDVFLQVRAAAAEKPEPLSFEQWMFQIARATLKSRMDELEKRRNDRHIEESVVPAVRWEDEDFHFYQPDESLRVEDLLRDGRSSNPEQLMERDEIEGQLHQAIAGLPEELRESFVLFALEGFNSDEVAMMTGKEPDQVLRDVEEARDALRRTLAT